MQQVCRVSFLLILFCVLPLWAAKAASDPRVNMPAKDLQSFLDERGYLKLPASFSGVLDPTGFELISKRGQAPRFVAKASGAPELDERWGDDFAPGAGCDGGIDAIAIGPSGEVYFGGRFLSCAGVLANRVIRYLPSTGAWEALGDETGNGVSDNVNAIVAVPDGVYVGGWFNQSNVGNPITSNYVARWAYDGSGWSAVGSSGGNGVDAVVLGMAAANNGDVFVGGDFTKANLGADVVADSVARWSPLTESWSPLAGVGGQGALGFVNTIVVDGDSVLVGGVFGSVNLGTPISAGSIARWNPSEGWSRLGDGVNGAVYAIVVSESQVYVGGRFDRAGTNVSTQGLASWDLAGEFWWAPGNGLQSDGFVPEVYALATAGDSLYVGGFFQSVDSVSPVPIEFAARLDVATNQWSSWNGILGDGLFGTLRVIQATTDGFYVGGFFGTVTDDGNRELVGNAIRWDLPTATATSLATTDGQEVSGRVSAMAVLDGSVFVGGQFGRVGELYCGSIARWDGQAWTGLGTDGGCGVAGTVSDIEVVNGKLYVAGSFGQVNAGPSPLAANSIALWDPVTGAWSALGTDGGNGADGHVFALEVYGGDLYLGGYFFNVNVGAELSANYFARWSLSEQRWIATESTGDAGFDDAVRDLHAADGDLYVSGWFNEIIVGSNILELNRLARWDGQSFTKVGSEGGSGVSGFINAMTSAEGYLYVGGLLSEVNFGNSLPVQGIARWDLSAETWSALAGGLGAGLDRVSGLTVADGELYAVGSFLSANSGQVPAARVASWNLADESWRAVGSGINDPDRFVVSTVHDGLGSLYVGGDFRIAGGKSSMSLARYETRGDLVVRIEGAGSGRVVSAPAGINCPSICTVRMGWNNIGLIAQAAPGSYLESWTGADCDTSGVCVFEFQQDRVVVANFEFIGGLFADGFE